MTLNKLQVYLRGESTLDAMAQRLRDLLNIPPRNKIVRDQKRESLNLGGVYYRFEVFGLTLELVGNAGEAQMDERADWPYYLLLAGEDGVDPKLVDSIAEYLAQLARTVGLEAETDSLH